KVSLKKSGVGAVLAGSYPWVHSLSRRPPFSWQVMCVFEYKRRKFCHLKKNGIRNFS
ncbi:hypothetical protein B296_00050957, partial [Ensete ventricosum]